MPKWFEYFNPRHPNFLHVLFGCVIAAVVILSIGVFNLVNMALWHAFWAAVIGIGLYVADRVFGPQVAHYFGIGENQGVILYNRPSRKRFYAAITASALVMLLFGGGRGLFTDLLMTLIMVFVMYIAFEIAALVFDNKDAIAATAREVSEGKTDHLRERVTGAAGAVRDRTASAAHEVVNEASDLVGRPKPNGGGPHPPTH